MKNRIKQIRKQKSISQTMLANAITTTRVNISLYENNKREPKLETWIKLANALGVSVAYLQGFPEETEEQKNCPYCHTYTETTGDVHEKPQKYLLNNEKEHFRATMYISNGRLVVFTVDDSVVWGSGAPKIKFCPMCGRRFNDEGDKDAKR